LKNWLSIGAKMRLRPKAVMILLVFASAMALTGCAARNSTLRFNPAPHEAKQFAPRQYAKLQVRRSDAELLTAQPVPDCQFRSDEAVAVDQVEFARLRMEYERKCYQKAEVATRERLTKLQARVKRTF
jgi:hypothetical protein